MKVHIIHLDSHDDHVSARDKLGWAKAPRVLFVWPLYGRVLTRKLDLVLLQRFAAQHSLQIGLVTSDPDVIDNANALAIPWFDHLDRVSEIGWRRRARGRPKRVRTRSLLASDRQVVPRPTPMQAGKRSQSRIFTASIMSIAVISLIAMVALLIPSAELTISPPTERLDADFEVRLDPGIEMPDAEEGIFPAQVLSTRISDSLRIPTTGMVAVPSTPANGSVTFTNLTSDPIDIPAGTGLRATEYENERFVTLEEVSLSGASGAQTEASVEASFAGPSGNLPPYSIDAVEGTLGLQLSVKNTKPLSGGENEIRAAAAAEDFSSLEASLTEILNERALEQFGGMLEEDQELLAHTLHFGQSYERAYDREIGEQADTLALTLDIEIHAYAYIRADVEAAARAALVDNLPARYELVAGTFDFEVHPESANVRTGYVEIEGNAWQDIYEPVDKALLRDLLRGQEPSVAQTLVDQAVDLMEKPDLRLFPVWIPRIPYLPTQITIHYIWETDA